MKSSCFIVLFAILGYSQARIIPNIGDGEEEGQLIIDCFKNAIDGGIEEIGIPNHNPLELRDISIFIGDALFGISLNITNGLWKGLVDFTDTVSGLYSEEDNSINYNYSIVYLKQVITFNVDLGIHILTLQKVEHANVSATINNIIYEGNMDLVLGENQTIRHFTVRTPGESVEVKVSGLSDPSLNAVISDLSSHILTDLVKSQFVVDAASLILSPLLQYRLNSAWVEGHPERTDILFEHCKAK